MRNDQTTAMTVLVCDARDNMGQPRMQTMSSLNRDIAVDWLTDVTEVVPRLLGRPATAWADFVAEHRNAWL